MKKITVGLMLLIVCLPVSAHAREGRWGRGVCLRLRAAIAARMGRRRRRPHIWVQGQTLYFRVAEAHRMARMDEYKVF